MSSTNLVPAQPRRLRLRPTTDLATAAILEFQSPTAELIARPVPMAGRLTTWAIFSMVAAGLLVAGVFPIDRVVTANGRVTSQAATIVVQPLETAIVRAINVREGQVVHKGDVLARLDPTFTAADVGTYAAQAVSLKAEVDRLRAEAAGAPYVSDGTPAGQLQAAIFGQREAERSYKLQTYRDKIASLQAAVVRATSDVQSYTARLDGAKKVEAMRKELENLQVGSRLNSLSAVDNRLDIQQHLDTAKNQITSATSDLMAMVGERDAYIQQARAEISQQLTDQQRKLSDAQEQLNKADLRHKLVNLTADQDAVVQKVAAVSVGSVLQSGDQFITMVPSDSALEVEAYVAGRESGFVHVGDPVTIKFDTFTYSLYGFASGHVTSVSADSFQNPTEDRTKLARPSQNDDTGLGPVYYRARVSLDEVKLHDLPPGFRLTPGMPINADIKVGQRTILGYMVGRVIPNMSEGMREP